MRHSTHVFWAISFMVAACGAEPDPAPTGSADGAATAEPYCTRDEQCEAGYWCEGGDCLDADGANSRDAHPCEDTADPWHDVYHCGACGNRCSWGSAGAIWCEDGVCRSAAGVPNEAG